MKPAPFVYRAPSTLDEVLDLLAREGAAVTPLAGGQSLVPSMNFRLATPAVLADLNGVAELFFLEDGPDGDLRIGAMTRQRSVERSDLAAKRAPLLAEAVPSIAHFQIRTRGTIGGSLAHADPAAELPAVMVALDARVRLCRRGGERWVAAENFFTGLFGTVREPEELLVEIAVPRAPAGSGDAFLEVARRHGDYALVGVAVRVVLDDTARCRDARIALLSVGDRPVRAAGAEAVLRNEVPGPALLEAAGECAAGADIDPPGDIHASPAYRRRLTRVLVRRAVARAVERAARPRSGLFP